jgi:hypothetical protein
METIMPKPRGPRRRRNRGRSRPPSPPPIVPESGDSARRPTMMISIGDGPPMPVYGDVEFGEPERLIDGTVAVNRTIINAERPTRFVRPSDVN